MKQGKQILVLCLAVILLLTAGCDKKAPRSTQEIIEENASLIENTEDTEKTGDTEKTDVPALEDIVVYMGELEQNING